MKLGVTTDFSAAHTLSRHPGKCKNLHGHTYKVDVVVEGDKKEDTECVADFAEMKAVIEEIIELVDHKYLNEVTLHSIRLWEGKDKWVMVERD